jgi:hypothetical protein
MTRDIGAESGTTARSRMHLSLVSLSPGCGHQMAATAENLRSFVTRETGTHGASSGFQGCYADPKA